MESLRHCPEIALDEPCCRAEMGRLAARAKGGGGERQADLASQDIKSLIQQHSFMMRRSRQSEGSWIHFRILNEVKKVILVEN